MDSDRRRDFLLRVGGASVLLAGASRAATAAATKGAGNSGKKKGKEDAEPGVAPPEDLMREHGVLNRILLIYEESIRRADAKRAFPAEPVATAADIIRRFIEQYHEKLEEDHLFPRFEKAGKLSDLTAILRRQHQVGRTLTDQITALAKAKLADVDRAKLASLLRSFNHMYRPHAAREDTVLFPAFHELVSHEEYASLGEVFEDEEHRLFGERGFGGIVAEVAQLERAIGIHDLARFTPP